MPPTGSLALFPAHQRDVRSAAHRSPKSDIPLTRKRATSEGLRRDASECVRPFARDALVVHVRESAERCCAVAYKGGAVHQRERARLELGELPDGRAHAGTEG
jgi:hypothetical protein